MLNETLTKINGKAKFNVQVSKLKNMAKMSFLQPTLLVKSIGLPKTNCYDANFLYTLQANISPTNSIVLWGNSKKTTNLI